MSQAKVLSPEKINPQYEPIYTGKGELELLIEKINCGLCAHSNFQQIKNDKSVDLFFDKKDEEQLIEIFEEGIKSEFQDVGWHIRVVRLPRQPIIIVLKASPFNGKDTGSGGL